MNIEMANRIREVEKQEKKLMKKHGWIIHHVYETEENEFDGMANTHTYGLSETYSHPDFQMVLPIHPNIIQQLFNILVARVKNGETFEEGKNYEKVIQNSPVHFKEFKEDGRKVLRMILPDENAKMPSEIECDALYKKQYLTFFPL